MNKLDVLHQIGSSKIIAVVQEDNADTAFKAAMACIEGGIRCLEIALTTPCGLDVIEELTKVDDVIVGAGTVLDAETAKAAIQVGASFLLSPAVDAAMIRMCSKYGVVSVPGAFTPTEVVTALDAGADIVKIFPAQTLGPQYLESLSAPFPKALFLPSGGVTVENLEQWTVSKGVFAVGVGASLTAGAQAGDYGAITHRARRCTEMVRAAKGKSLAIQDHGHSRPLAFGTLHAIG